jgi:hypothetical protein
MAKHKVNYSRMLDLVDEVFSTRSDPNQIQVTQEQQNKIFAIHQFALTERSNEEGPLIWLLIIPTLKTIMEDFLIGKITEKEILDNTPIGVAYESIYLCSVTTLMEERGKGSTKELCMKAIDEIKKDNPIESLFVWPFTKEGEALAKNIANASHLKLFTK